MNELSRSMPMCISLQEADMCLSMLYLNMFCFESYIWLCQISGLEFALLHDIGIVVALFALCVGKLLHYSVEQIRSS